MSEARASQHPRHHDHQMDVIRAAWDEILPQHAGLGAGEDIVLDTLLKLCKAGDKVLEVGAGRGRMLGLLRTRRPAIDCHALDFNEYVKAAHAHAVRGDARRSPYREGVFDLTFSLGVIEHFHESGEALSEHCRMTQPGGWVLVTTPRLSIYTPLRYLTWIVKLRHLGAFKPVMGTNFRDKTLRKYFEAAGLERIQVVRYGSRVPKLRWVQRGMASTRLARRIGSNVMIIGRKPEG